MKAMIVKKLDLGYMSEHNNREIKAKPEEDFKVFTNLVYDAEKKWVSEQPMVASSEYVDQQFQNFLDSIAEYEIAYGDKRFREVMSEITSIIERGEYKGFKDLAQKFPRINAMALHDNISKEDLATYTGFSHSIQRIFLGILSPSEMKFDPLYLYLQQRYRDISVNDLLCREQVSDPALLGLDRLVNFDAVYLQDAVEEIQFINLRRCAEERKATLQQGEKSLQTLDRAARLSRYLSYMFSEFCDEFVHGASYL